MTLPVPLTVRIGDRHVTSRVEGLSFRKEMAGVKSIAMRLLKPIDRLGDVDTTLLSKVYVYDARTAECLAEGRLTDTGRGVDESGQRWDLVAFGPAQHAYDVEIPVIYVDQSVTDGWRQVNRMHRGGQVSQSTLPSDASDSSPESIVFNFPEGSTVAANDTVTFRNERLRECGQFLARISFDWDSGGPADGDYRIRLWTSVDGSGGSAAFSANHNPAGGSASLVTVTDFTNGRNVPDLIMERQSGTGKPADDSKWFGVYNWSLRARLKDKDGSDITTGYSNNYVLSHEVFKDLLGRALPEFAGDTADVDTSGSYQFDQLAYPDGAPVGQILDDLMVLEKTHYWTARPSGNDGRYRVAWRVLPTTIKYEVVLDSGGDFPVSAQELANEVSVRWRDKRGRVRSKNRTASAAGVSDAYLTPSGTTRKRVIDASDEIGSSAGALRLADNYLANHASPANAGTITIAAPVRDVTLNKWVRPHEIEPGELIRVRGVESYQDSFNASSSDGQTVFRIFSVTYNSDSDTAVLELDTYSRSTANKLAKLQRRRSRKR